MTPRHFRTRTGQGGDTSLFIARKRRRRSALPLQSKTASQRACGLDKEAAGRGKRPREVALPAAGIGGHAVGLEDRVVRIESSAAEVGKWDVRMDLLPAGVNGKAAGVKYTLPAS